ncbi:hypothetical protein Tco_0226487 [Tanacetum coccineum]
MVSRDRCPSLKLHYGEIACISTLSSKKYQFGAIRLELPLVYLHVWKLVMQSSEKMNGYSYQGDGSLVVGYLCEESLNEHAGGKRWITIPDAYRNRRSTLRFIVLWIICWTNPDHLLVPRKGRLLREKQRITIPRMEFRDLTEVGRLQYFCENEGCTWSFVTSGIGFATEEVELVVLDMHNA